MKEADFPENRNESEPVILRPHRRDHFRVNPLRALFPRGRTSTEAARVETRKKNVFKRFEKSWRLLYGLSIFGLNIFLINQSFFHAASGPPR